MNIETPDNPVEIQTVQLKEADLNTGSATQIALTEDEQFLQVTVVRQAASSPLGNAQNILKINPNGTLTEVPTSPTNLPSVNNSFPLGAASIKF